MVGTMATAACGPNAAAAVSRSGSPISQAVTKAKKKATKKTAAKTAVVTTPNEPALVTQAHGGSLLTGGVPGNAGGTGRPPNWLKDWCDELLASEKSKEQVKEILEDKTHSAYHQMWKAVAERAHGKPVQPIGGDPTQPIEILVRFVRE